MCISDVDRANAARTEPTDCGGIAIVGVAGRFPGAADVAAFWRNLCTGVESIRHFDADELEDAFGADVRADRSYVAARAVLDDVDRFDAGFFGMHAREAALTDPQHRVLLECAWDALEDAGYDPETYAGAIGVVAGCSIGTYFLRHVLRERDAIETFTSNYQVGSFPELLGSGSDFLATRIAYKLNLRGPAMTVQSACSTSLLAVAQACQQLTLRQADLMLAGAASITFPQARGYLHQSGGMVAADGHCRTFDANATGTVFGSGAGVVALKRLADARADGDAIYAVIRGYGVTNDGARKMGYTAPSVEGQAAAISAAHAMAGFDPASIAYVECHGTATPLGDPIEVAALTRAFAGVPSGTSCALGSVKTNIGHLDVAAGMSGLIKTALAIREGIIPPTLHFAAPNPHIDFAGGPFHVNTTAAAWPDERRRAGVSAFGIGGTNVHVVLEAEPPAVAAASCEPQLLVVSARSETALARAGAQLADRIAAGGDDELAPIAFTLQTGRRAFPYRRAVTAATAAEAAAALRAPVAASGPAASEPGVAFLFPGQGAQFAGMGRELYARLPVFRAALDRCSEQLEPVLGARLVALLTGGDAAGERTLARTALAQPAIFAVEYALAQVWLDWGVRPAAMLGHSVGEFVAATLAGVMSLEDALGLVAERGRLIGALPGGAMLAVRLPEADLAPLLGPSTSVAAINAPGLTVAAGPYDTIAALEAELDERGVPHRRLATSHAFHSPMMDSAVEPLVRRAAAIRMAEPAIPWISGVTGTWITAAEATSPAYWGRHARDPVRFADGIATLAGDRVTAFLEAGPGSTLSTLAARAARGAGATVVASLDERTGGGELRGMLEALGRLWAAGAVTPAWRALHPVAPGRRSLPTYPYERSRHWIDAAATPMESPRHMNGALPAPDTAASAAAPPDGDRRPRLQREFAALLEELSGEPLADADAGSSFLELGFDSLFLGRFAQQLHARAGVAVTFRQLLGEIPSLAALAAHADATLPPDAAVAAPAAASAAAPGAAAAPDAAAGSSPAVERLMREQMQAMQQLFREQLAVLGGTAPVAAAPVAVAPAAAVPATDDAPSRFDVYKTGTSASRSEITPEQRAHIDALIARTLERTSGSKALTQRYRPVLADPRSASGFRAEWKEMVYPITCVRAHGSRLWDVDGNEYIDIVNGFGQTFFGHAPDFVVDAVRGKLADGFAIGPQTELAGEVAELFCELTGNERVTFCNTGSEAVMAAMRVARTVTGRERVVVFNGAYHGQFDEVLVKGARRAQRSLPAAPGIPSESVANMTVLTYGADESLQWIREHAAEIAAVIVEPVQSRHPGLQPAAFLTELRAITAAAGSALVFDEVVTGFRMHPAGMQHVFGVRADLATYGKVVGGGLPVGILAGSARFMDALDGGMWQYGDDSFPEVAPTFFAGTFVRHPLVMAAVRAVLVHVKERGAELQSAVTARTARLVQRLNGDLAARGIDATIEHCGSLFYVNLAGADPLASLLYFHLRARGIYVLEGFPCFLTTEHTDADVESIARAFAESFDALQAAGIFAPSGMPATAAADVQPTEEQTEIWLAAQLGDDASRAFNESVTLRLRGSLDEPAFAAAWERVRARHDALRATFAPTGESMQVAGGGSFALERSDVAALAPAERDASLAALIDREARTPFDLVAGPLVRGHLLRLSSDDHAFVLTAHHIVCDGWSINVLLEEFAALYGALRRGTDAALPAPMAFSAYARAQHERDATERARVERFWLERFAEPVPPLDLPADRPRSTVRTFAGATRSATISRERADAIKKAGARNGCTLFATLLGGFATLMGRLAGARDVVVGVPAAGQASLEDAVLVGHCVHFLPIRLQWAAGEPLADVLAMVKRRVMDAYDHQDYTLGTLVRALALPRSAGRLPLTEIQFNLERLADGLALPGLDAEVTPNAKAFVNFDLFVNVIESRDGLRIDCDYNADLYDAETIDRWLRSYAAVLDAIVADMTTPVERIAYLPADQRQLLLDVNRTAQEYPDSLVHELIAARAAERPGAPAVICGERTLTYAELDARANRFAHHLGASTQPGDLVGIAVDRSAEMLVALLGTLKAGCAYVPLDRRQPAARLRAMLQEAAVAAVVIDDAPLAATFVPDGVPAIDVVADAGAIALRSDAPPAVSRKAHDLAYVIFTSGSTGTPKGVEIEHRSLGNFLRSMTNEPGLAAGDVLVAVTTIAFDIAALELFLPLVTGATVAIATSDEVTDGYRLRERIERVRATALQATPSTWRMLLEAGFRAPSGFTMLCGGEALPRDLANALLGGAGRLWNMYGPTETTIWSSCTEVLAGEGLVTVGRPIANTQFHVLDANDQPVGPGQTGELHIGGDGVARGYLRRPDLTAEKFIPNPFGAGRLYRTGDVARILPSGETHVLGRIDQQVKVRGFRIELGEIEAVLAAKGGVAASAVALHADATGAARLVGYYVEREGEPRTGDALGAVLGEHLPEYMIPAAWVRLERLPLTANGKLDRAALPAPDAVASADAYVAPATPLEQSLARIWCGVLKRERIGTTDDVFALGADSINLFAITARANREGIPLVAKQLFAHRTIGRLAQHLESLPATAVPAPAALRRAARPLASRERVSTGA